MGQKVRESRAVAALRKTRMLKAMASARSPYWRDRAKAGEQPQRGLQACPHCQISVPITYGTTDSDGKLRLCEECRLTARSQWIESLREQGIWPPKLPHWFDEEAKTFARTLVQKPIVNPREAEAIRLYDWLVATAGEPLVTVGIDDLWSMAEAVDRSIAAMESAIERGERKRRAREAAAEVTAGAGAMAA